MASWVWPAASAAASVISNIFGNSSAKRAAKRAATQKRNDIYNQYKPEEFQELFNNYYGGLMGGQNAWQPGQVNAQGRPVRPEAGQALVYQIMQLLQNPGQVSPIEYVRAQEQGNMFQRASQNAVIAAGSRLGYGQNSGILDALMLAGLMANQRLRNERMRDLTLTSENLRRQDIGAGAALYNQALSQIFGLQNAKAAALAGIPSNQSNQGTYQGIGNVFGMLANTLGQGGSGQAASPAASPASSASVWSPSYYQNWGSGINWGK